MADECTVPEAEAHRPRSVRFGGLRGRIQYDDDAFAWPDPEIEKMFYGDDPSDDAPFTSSTR